MKSPNPIILGFGALSLGVMVGFLISSISQNRIEEPVNRVNITLESILFLLILCILIGGAILAFK